VEKEREKEGEESFVALVGTVREVRGGEGRGQREAKGSQSVCRAGARSQRPRAVSPGRTALLCTVSQPS
jgi:hypothetical protein